ncbi:MAG: tetratricopeptide repeat protein [Cyanobacteria bacterium J06634_6]
MPNPLPPSELILKHLQLAPLSQQTFASPFIRSQHRATRHWLTRRQNIDSSSPIAQIEGLLQAFTHLCDLQDWVTASKLLTLRLNTPTQEELDNQLHTWGYYQQQRSLYEPLLGKLNDEWQAILLNGLGNVHNSLGNHHTALTYHQQTSKSPKKLATCEAKPTPWAT